MAVLIDTSFLLAATYTRDKNHAAAREQMRLLKMSRIIPAPILSELFYMTIVRINYSQAVKTLETTQSSVFEIADLTTADRDYMIAIMRRYEDAEFDYVDVSILALAERLNITQICTFDRRDFSIYRPAHADYLELLP